jgi:hypothetical protein
MDTDRRTGDKPLPNKLRDALNDEQLLALPALERFGWELQFVRRPPFQDTVPVVRNAEGTMVGILEEDGRLNLQLDVQLRESTGSVDNDATRARRSEK